MKKKSADIPKDHGLTEQSPLGSLIRGMKAVAEPGGALVPVILSPAPLQNASGALAGVGNTPTDSTERENAGETAQRLAAIVASSYDAIISKDLNGLILSWNEAAERLFGYAAEEAIGKLVTILIPPDRFDEESMILEKIRRGEHIKSYETIRQRKDGSLVEISLTVSPIKNADGKVVGASKIARDITESRRAQKQQQMLLREMDHRIKNLFTLSRSLVTLSVRSAKTPEELALVIRDRLGALARAHTLTLSMASDGTSRIEQATTLQTLIKTIISPYDGRTDEGGERMAINGSDVPLAGGFVTSFALLLHEFTTNAVKYGALSTQAGHIDIHCSEEGDRFVLTWKESGGPYVDRRTDGEGYGSVLARMTVTGQLGGEISRDWRPEGLVIRISVARARLVASK